MCLRLLARVWVYKKMLEFDASDERIVAAVVMLAEHGQELLDGKVWKAFFYSGKGFAQHAVEAFAANIDHSNHAESLDFLPPF